MEHEKFLRCGQRSGTTQLGSLNDGVSVNVVGLDCEMNVRVGGDPSYREATGLDHQAQRCDWDSMERGEKRRRGKSEDRLLISRSFEGQEKESTAGANS